MRFLEHFCWNCIIYDTKVRKSALKITIFTCGTKKKYWDNPWHIAHRLALFLWKITHLPFHENSAKMARWCFWAFLGDFCMGICEGKSVKHQKSGFWATDELRTNQDHHWNRRDLEIPNLMSFTFFDIFFEIFFFSWTSSWKKKKCWDKSEKKKWKYFYFSK